MGITAATAIIIAGLSLIVVLLLMRWPGWIGLPFAFITLNLIRNLATTPLADLLIGRYWINPTEGVAAPEEIGAASFMVLINSISIVAGMVLFMVVLNILPHRKKNKLTTTYSYCVCSRAWFASFLLFLFSILCQVIIFSYLLSEVPLQNIASSRAVFSDEIITANPLFSYAKLFSNAMTIAVWGMLLFAGQKRSRMILAAVGIISAILLEINFGSRMHLVSTIIGIAIVFHYGVKKIRLKKAFLLCMVLMIGLTTIQLIRNKTANVSLGVRNVAVDILIASSVDKAAFAMRHFPEDVPFSGIGFASNELSKLVPTVRRYMDWNKNIWDDIVIHLKEGRSGFIGKGGNHYTPAAESYMQFGFSGVVVIGLLVGFFYGLIFSWQRRNPDNPFLLMLAAYSFVAFSMSLLNGKMLSWVSSIGFGALIPIGFLIITTFRIKWELFTLVFLASLCILSFFAKRIIGLPVIFDLIFAATLFVIYVLIVCLIGKKRKVYSLRLTADTQQ